MNTFSQSNVLKKYLLPFPYRKGQCNYKIIVTHFVTVTQVSDTDVD